MMTVLSSSYRFLNPDDSLKYGISNPETKLYSSVVDILNPQKLTGRKKLARFDALPFQMLS